MDDRIEQPMIPKWPGLALIIIKMGAPPNIKAAVLKHYTYQKQNQWKKSHQREIAFRLVLSHKERVFIKMKGKRK